MNVNTGRQIVLAARPSSKPQLSDFRLEEVGVPTPRSGQVLLGVLYLSLDPYMRGRMDDRKSYAKPLQVGDVMVGEAVARVIESRHPEYSERDIVLAQTGWRTHAVADGAAKFQRTHLGKFRRHFLNDAERIVRAAVEHDEEPEFAGIMRLKKMCIVAQHRFDARFFVISRNQDE